MVRGSRQRSETTVGWQQPDDPQQQNNADAEAMISDNRPVPGSASWRSLAKFGRASPSMKLFARIRVEAG
jgi:hypothetical protein